MTHLMPIAADMAEEQAAAEATLTLELALYYAGISFDLEESAPHGGSRLRLEPSPTHPWTLGDVEGNLLADGIIATARRIEQPLPCPGARLALDLPSTEDVRALGRLVETRLTEIQNAALQLHRALGLADLERRVGILDDCLIDTGAFTPDDAACLYRCLGGDDVAVRDLALTEWRDHESFADYLETTVHTATGRMVPVESRPTCGHCRDDNGPNQIWIDFLDADDALALAAALKRVRNTKE
ncbi:hypothetical protein [Streptomyces sp. NPDC008125]|uniref:hypothetical protein n=1 Tax=Streptomyces sp. NPDC008125 TaxID=3364811 RepID=UPI0036E08057